MSKHKRSDRKLVELKTGSEKDKAFIVESCEKALKVAQEGGMKQLMIVYEDTDGCLRSSSCSYSRWSMIGMLETAKAGLIIENAD